MAQSFHFKPVTQSNLVDLQSFSAAHGKFRYCSCMRWRFTSSQFSKSNKEERIAALDDLVCAAVPVGVLAYDQTEKPVGWCSIAPRERLGALERSRTLPRIDEIAVWSVTCFFINRYVRRQGLTLVLLNAAVDYAVSQGAQVIEGYPVDPQSTSYTYMGSPQTFSKAGFVDVTPTGNKRPIFRYTAPAI